MRVERVKVDGAKVAVTDESVSPAARFAAVLGTELVAEYAPTAEGVMCSMEMKRCPDGTEVARTGPHCEFAPCPDAGSQRNHDGRPPRD